MQTWRIKEDVTSAAEHSRPSIKRLDFSLASACVVEESRQREEQKQTPCVCFSAALSPVTGTFSIKMSHGSSPEAVAISVLRIQGF